MVPTGYATPTREIWRTLRDSPAFGLALLLTLALAGFNGVMVAFMALRLDALLPASFAQMGHFTQPHHRIHDLTFGFLFLPVIVGIVAQFRRPARNIAGMVMAVIPAAGLATTLAATLALAGDARALQPPWVMVGAAALIAAGLHPAGGDLFSDLRRARASLPMLGLTVAAAVPLLVFAASNLRLQAVVSDDHAAAGHYGFLAGFAVTIIGTALLASLRPTGWRPVSWTAALLAALLALSSVAYPDTPSSLTTPWAMASLGWSAAFATTAQLTRR